MALDLNLNKPLAVIGVVLAAVIGLLVLSALLPTLFSATASITENVTTGDVGNATANSLLSVFGLVVPLVIIVGIIGLVILVARFKSN